MPPLHFRFRRREARQRHRRHRTHRLQLVFLWSLLSPSFTDRHGLTRLLLRFDDNRNSISTAPPRGSVQKTIRNCPANAKPASEPVDNLVLACQIAPQVPCFLPELHQVFVKAANRNFRFFPITRRRNMRDVITTGESPHEIRFHTSAECFDGCPVPRPRRPHLIFRGIAAPGGSCPKIHCRHSPTHFQSA